jgi:tRNA(Arg) A34 adenosine deaminase TadA
MAEVVRFTAGTMATDRPVPFGALILETKTGKLLKRAVNSVAKDNDPSSHAELRTVRLACKKLKSTSLRGYTLYSTCEPCAMCMANLLWSGIDRVVFGAPICQSTRFRRYVMARAMSTLDFLEHCRSLPQPLWRLSATLGQVLQRLGSRRSFFTTHTAAIHRWWM